MNKSNLKISFVAIACLFAISVSNGRTTINTPGLDSLLDILSSKNRFMGCLTISKNGNILYNKAYGISSVDNNINQYSTTETKYRIGSISKMFTSVMIFQLIEEDKLSMETKLFGFFPEVPNSENISISNLLNHRSGIYSFTNDSAYLSWNTKPHSHSELLKKISSGKPAFKPGQRSGYSNSNYLLLGYIIEKITNKDYPANLKERITDKIGLKNTCYGGKARAGENECFSFKYDNNKWVQETETDMSIPGGAGAIVSTTNDLSLFITALFDGKLICANSLNNMKMIKAGYGNGIFQETFYGKTAFGHGGAIDRFVSSLHYIINDSTSIALCCNTDYGTYKIVKDVLAIYYDKPYQVPAFNHVRVCQDTLRQYEGVYEHWVLPVKIIIKPNGESLTADVAGQGPLYYDPISNNEFSYYSLGGSFVITGNKLSFYQANMIPHRLKFKRKKK